MFKVGEVVKITGYKGESKERLVKIVEVRDTWAQPIVNKKRPIKRSRYLVTARDMQGRERSFYTDMMSVGSGSASLAEKIRFWLWAV